MAVRPAKRHRRKASSKGGGQENDAGSNDTGADGHPPAIEKRGSRLRQASVGEQFRSQLHELITLIDPLAAAAALPSSSTAAAAPPPSNAPSNGPSNGGGSTCAYVRCIKANEHRSAWELDHEACTHQLRCAGMLEAVRIRQETFAARWTHPLFLASFRVLPCAGAVAPALEPCTDATAGAARALTAALATSLGEEESTWQCGLTKIFARQQLAGRLTHWASVRRRAAVRTLQHAVSAFNARKRARAASALQRGWTRYNAVTRGRAERCMARRVASATARWHTHARRIGHVSRMREAVPCLQHAARRLLAVRVVARKRAEVDAARAAAEAARAAAKAADDEFILSPPRMLGPGVGGVPVFAPPAACTPAQVHIRALASPSPPKASAIVHAEVETSVMSLSELQAGDLQRAVQRASAPAPKPSPAAAKPPPPSASPAAPAVAKVVRTIEQLGPKRALCVEGGVSVASVASQMLDARSEAVLVVRDGASSHSGTGASGACVLGILTATDIARRVVAVGRSPADVTAAEVMTREPHTVRATDAADDALSVMMSGSFRHVPVLSPVAPPRLLDLVRCLFDVIAMLERAQAAGEALLDAVSRQAGSEPTSGASGDLLGPALSTLLAPRLTSLVASCDTPFVVAHDADLCDAAKGLLAAGVTAVLVRQTHGSHELLTPKAILTAVAEGGGSAHGVGGLASNETPPLLIPAECSVLDALHQLQAEKRSHALLMTDGDDAKPRVVLDMLQLVRVSLQHAERSADAQQLNAFMGAAAALSEVGTAEPYRGPAAGGASHAPASHVGGPMGAIHEDELLSPGQQSALPSELSFTDRNTVYEDVRPEDSISMIGVNREHGASRVNAFRPYHAPPPPGRGAVSMPPSALGANPLGEFEQIAVGGATGLLLKLRDQFGQMHRVRCEPSDGWDAVRTLVEAKAGGGECTKLLYTDDDGDPAAIDSDEALIDAAAQARRTGENRLAVTVVTAASAAASAMDVSEAQRPAQSLDKAYSTSAVSSFLGGLIAASSLAVGTGLLLAAKAAKR